jgi:hypothetical protein
MSHIRKKLSNVFGFVQADNAIGPTPSKASQGNLRNNVTDMRSANESLFATVIQQVMGAARPFGPMVHKQRRAFSALSIHYLI